jgi:2-methylcitrate dehydratase PrpD
VDRQTSVGPKVQLARHVSTLQYEQLPAELVHLIKQCILDTLGVAIAASTLAPRRASSLIMCASSEVGNRNRMGFGDEAPAPSAVFVNDRTYRSGPVLDDDAFRQTIRQPLRQEAHCKVAAASRGEPMIIRTGLPG